MDTPLNLNDAILNIQRYLRAISFADERITRPPLDGLFDSDTRRAVEDFQEIYGLPVTGIVDKATHDEIFREYLALTEATSRRPTPSFFPRYPEGYSASRGEKSSFVALLQIILRELKSVYDGIPEIEIDGIYGPLTEEAVRVFQERSGLTPDGRVDLSTWNRLTGDFFAFSAF